MIEFALGALLGGVAVAYVPRFVGSYPQARRDGFTRMEALEITWRHRAG